ncbi:hypothetical protein [Streptomyces collinus]|uniref:hypothetical protein n=1 Tax=Streptomyces collinus TaxID=42684 RepID=UPI0036EA3DC1
MSWIGLILPEAATQLFLHGHHGGMPHADIPQPTQLDSCPLCATRRTEDLVPDVVGRYSLASGAQYRCSACDAWLCAGCGDRPVADAAGRCGVCCAPQGAKRRQAIPSPGILPASAGETTCIRRLKTQARRCSNPPTDWPEVEGEPAPVAACWVHLSAKEREDCNRARSLRAAEARKIWEEGEPERQRRAAEAEAERLARVASCPCAEQLPESVEKPFGGPAPNRCKGCGSWLCASCDQVRVPNEGAQCEGCRPDVTEPACNGDHSEDEPYYRITVGGLECFTEAMGWLIRAGAHSGGRSRVFAVHLPVCDSQAEALEALKTFASGSDAGNIKVTLVPEDATVAVDPGLPQPDLSGLGDIDRWWYANGYPPGDRMHQPWS